MAIRDSMGDLIMLVRTLVFDPYPNSGSPTFSDQQIQDALDLYREEQRWVALRPMPTFTPGGNILYLDYYHSTQNWEADVVLQDLSYTTISPALSELIVGHWQFATQPVGIGVRATGKTYDLYSSAADVLAWWLSQIKLTAFNVRTRSQTVSTADQVKTITGLIESYRRRALPHTHRLFQGDAAPDQDGGGVTYPSVAGTPY